LHFETAALPFRPREAKYPRRKVKESNFLLQNPRNIYIAARRYLILQGHNLDVDQYEMAIQALLVSFC
jgi:hypothetical protein